MKKAQLIERMLEEDIRDKERSANTGDRDKQEIHDIDKLDSGETASGILEVMTEGFGFIRCENYRRERMMYMYRLHRSADLI